MFPNARASGTTVSGVGDLQMVGQAREHGAVHALAETSTHLVPEIAGHLELGLNANFDLGQREQVLKTGLTGNFLQDEPGHLIDELLASPARGTGDRLGRGRAP